MKIKVNFWKENFQKVRLCHGFWIRKVIRLFVSSTEFLIKAINRIFDIFGLVFGCFGVDNWFNCLKEVEYGC